MRVTAQITFVVVVIALAAASVGTYRPLLAQAPAKIAPMHVHHVHVNSMNPKAAADYYPKPFALSATRTTFNGDEAVKTGNVYMLFTKVDTPPQNELTGPQTSVWHFGWNTPDSRKYDEQFRAMGLKIAQMWDAADGKLVDMSSDTLPGLPTQEQILEMRAKGTQPTRAGGFGYLRGPDGAMIENAQAGQVERFNHIHMYHEHPLCAMQWYVTHLGATPPRSRWCAGGAAPGGLQTAVRPADVAVLLQVSGLCSRSVRRRLLRRHLHFDPAVAGRRTRQHARPHRRSLGAERGGPCADRRPVEGRRDQVPRRDPSVGQHAGGHDRGTRSRRH